VLESQFTPSNNNGPARRACKAAHIRRLIVSFIEKHILFRMHGYSASIRDNTAANNWQCDNYDADPFCRSGSDHSVCSVPFSFTAATRALCLSANPFLNRKPTASLWGRAVEALDNKDKLSINFEREQISYTGRRFQGCG
jgi:hypothetical protein